MLLKALSRAPEFRLTLGQSIMVQTDGLIIDRTTFIRWEDIDYGLYQDSTYIVVTHTNDHIRLFDRALIAFVEDTLARQRFNAVMTALHHQRSLSFGAIELHPHGVRVDGLLLPWANIHAITAEMTPASYSIRIDSPHHSFQIPAQHIRNLRLMLTVAQSFLSTPRRPIARFDDQGKRRRATLPVLCSLILGVLVYLGIIAAWIDYTLGINRIKSAGTVFAMLGFITAGLLVLIELGWSYQAFRHQFQHIEVRTDCLKITRYDGHVVTLRWTNVTRITLGFAFDHPPTILEDRLGRRYTLDYFLPAEIDDFLWQQATHHLLNHAVTTIAQGGMIVIDGKRLDSWGIRNGKHRAPWHHLPADWASVPPYVPNAAIFQELVRQQCDERILERV